jgi:hypothetical protein
MANTYYSSLYELNPYRGQATYVARAPGEDTRAKSVLEVATFTLATTVILGIGDQIKLITGFPAGTKVARFCINSANGYDSSTTLVFNLGWASQAAGIGLLTGATFLRAGATTSLTDAQVLAGTVCGGNVQTTTNLQAAGSLDELQFTVTTASTGAGTNGLATFLVELILP